MAIENIVVIGAGTMGNGIAQTAAVAGYQVTMTDVVPEPSSRENPPSQNPSKSWLSRYDKLMRVRRSTRE